MDGGLIFEIGGSTERVSFGSVDSVFFGRFSSISDTVSGFGAGGAGFACDARADSLPAVEAGAGSVLGSAGRALLIGGTPERLIGLCGCSVAGFFFLGEIRSVGGFGAGAALLSAGTSGFRGGFGVDSFRVLARVTMSDLFL
jgi:hypothetical protein